MWATVTMTILVMVSLSAAVGFGVAWSRAKENLKLVRRDNILKDQQIHVMKKAVEAEAHLHDKLEEIGTTRDLVRLTELYNEMVRSGGPK